MVRRSFPSISTSTLQKNRQTDPAGTLEKALERNLFNVRHDRPLPLLDLTLGEVRVYPYNLNKTRIPRRRKYSWRVCSMQLQGLRFKCINNAENIWSVRVTLGYRAIGVLDENTVTGYCLLIKGFYLFLSFGKGRNDRLNRT